MERADLMAMMAELSLSGMRTAYDEVMRDGRKRGRRQTLRGGSLRARLNGPARVDAWRLGCRKVMADQAAGAAV